MLCEVNSYFGFVAAWVLMTVMGFVTVLALSSVAFVPLYAHPTLATWQQKSCPRYPSAGMIKREIIVTSIGLPVATLSPAVALWLANRGSSGAYCGVGTYPLWYELATALVVVVASDLVEYLYHWAGHSIPLLWAEHKSHHVFANPSPFSVIADGPVDQGVRALPVLLLTLVPGMPVNVDMVFAVYLSLFYAYGVYLHSGHELQWPNAHTPLINTSFNHYVHHAKSVFAKPYFTGFFVNVWDKFLGSEWPEGDVSTCLCANCCRKRGERDAAAFKRVDIPDYSVLLQPSFWLSNNTGDDKEQ